MLYHFQNGGYARRELFSHSDVDILIIHNGDENTLKNLETFVAFLWTIGIEPAVRIHHCDDNRCVQDITIATSLLEHRFLSGDELFIDLPKQWLYKQYTAKTFFTAKYQEYKTRHQKNDYNEYTLEPNVKESVGGLRDIHFLHWIAKFYFNLSPDITLKDLVQSQFLTDKECDELIYAKHFLWLVRHYLHTNEQKDNNKLSFGLQKTLGEQLGFYDDNNPNPNHAPETLMKHYYRSAMSIATLCHYLGELFFNEFLEKETKIPLNEQYYISHNYFGEQLGIYDEALFKKQPKELLNAFLIMGEQGIKSLNAKTLRALKNASASIDKEFLNNPIHKELFLQNLDEPNYLFHRLRLMKRTHILGKYLPDFEHITGLSQYDLFHSYTVDAHTLMLIRILHRFYKDDFGLLSTVYKELDDPFILVVVGIFHDIAKGKNGDHSILGADIIKTFCQSHHINQKDSELMEWLVRHHLDMSITAQKKDIYDPAVIDDFANFVGDIRHLDYLYVLTVADMNATNSQLWNNWRASLLKQLYLATYAKLNKTIDTSPKSIIAQKQQFVLNKLNDDNIISFWKQLPDSYFLRHNKYEILWHSESLLAHQFSDNSNLPLVKIIPHKNKSLHAHKLFIYSKNMPSIFALTAVILDKFGFAIYNADILTDDKDFALDTYTIVNKKAANDSINNPNTKLIYHDDNNHQALIESLTMHLQNPSEFFKTHRPSERYFADKLKHFTIKTQVFFEANQNGTHNLQIITKDRPSLLAKIGQVFGEQRVIVHSAKITTLGERAEDSFVVDGEGLTADRQCQLIDELTNVLS